MPSVCLISNEVYPLNKGGIGRLMYNFAVHNAAADEPADLHLLLPNALAPRLTEVAQAFAGLATIHACPALLVQLGLSEPAMHELRRRDPLCERWVNALAWHAGLTMAEEATGRPFDVIEFPDLDGWATAALAARACGLAYQRATIAVRLHSSFSLIYHAEPGYHVPSDWIATIADFERKAMRDADLVVGHLPAIVERNVEAFRLPHAREGRTRLERPPILLDAAEEGEPADAGPRRQSFVFSSRLQPFKRPDLFIRAAILACDGGIDPECEFVLASYGWDRDYVGRLAAMIPADLAGRIRIEQQMDATERVALLRRSVVVIPSRFESYCVLAYECALRGTPMILAGDCEAFEPLAGWVDGENCRSFDGTAEHLAEVFLSGRFPAPRPADCPPPTRPYWSGGLPEPRPAATVPIGAVAYGFSDLSGAFRAVRRLSRMPDPPAPILVAIRRGLVEGAEMAGVRAELERAGARVSFTADGLPDEAAVEQAAGATGVERFLFLPEGWDLDAGYLGAAARALAGAPDAVAFATPVRRRDGGEERWEPFLGETPNLVHYRRPPVPPVGVAHVALLAGRPVTLYGPAFLEAAVAAAVCRGARVMHAPVPMATGRGGSDEVELAIRSIAHASSTARPVDAVVLAQ